MNYTKSHLKLCQYHRTILHVNIIEKLRPIFSHWETLPVNFWFYCKEVRGIHTGKKLSFFSSVSPSRVFALWTMTLMHRWWSFQVFNNFPLESIWMVSVVWYSTYSSGLAWKPCMVHKHTYFKYHSLKKQKQKQTKNGTCMHTLNSTILQRRSKKETQIAKSHKGEWVVLACLEQE